MGNLSACAEFASASIRASDPESVSNNTRAGGHFMKHLLKQLLKQLLEPVSTVQTQVPAEPSRRWPCRCEAS